MEETMTASADEEIASPARLPLPPRFVLGKIPVDRISMDYAAVLMVEALLHRGELPPLTVVGPNAHLVTLAGSDSRFAEAMLDADLAVPDGASIVMASRVLDVPIPERVTGGDLMERMCGEAAHYGFRVFLLGGLPGAAVMAAHNLRKRHPGLEICGMYCPPRGFEKDAVELARMLKTIADAAPDLLCVAFGAPKQEIWMQENRSQLNVGAIHGGGRGSGHAGGFAPAGAQMDAGDRAGMVFSFADGAAALVAKVPDREHTVCPAGDAAMGARKGRSPVAIDPAPRLSEGRELPELQE